MRACWVQGCSALRRWRPFGRCSTSAAACRSRRLPAGSQGAPAAVAAAAGVMANNTLRQRGKRRAARQPPAVAANLPALLAGGRLAWRWAGGERLARAWVEELVGEPRKGYGLACACPVVHACLLFPLCMHDCVRAGSQCAAPLGIGTCTAHHASTAFACIAAARGVLAIRRGRGPPAGRSSGRAGAAGSAAALRRPRCKAAAQPPSGSRRARSARRPGV